MFNKNKIEALERKILTLENIISDLTKDSRINANTSDGNPINYAYDGRPLYPTISLNHAVIEIIKYLGIEMVRDPGGITVKKLEK